MASLEKLVEFGDNLSTPRTISHTLLFKYIGDLKQAVRVLRESGYEVVLLGDGVVEAKEETALDNGQHNAFIESMKQIAKAYNGEYDGWGSPICK